jgi:DNA modification methylase
MAFKRKALAVLTRSELLEIGRSLGLEVSTGMRLDELIDIVAGSKKARLDRVLGALSRDTLKSICFAVGISAEGREKDVLRERILARARGEDGEAEPAPASAHTSKPRELAEASATADAIPVGKGAGKAAPATTAGPQQDLPWQAFPLLERSTAAAEGPASAPPRAGNGAGAASAVKPASWEITLDVAPKKPRVAWQGMWRKEVAVSVPTQVVEIVRPGRAVRRSDELSLDTRVVESRDTTSIPPSRLIWTNDNLVALQTLIDEKDPVTRDWRYRGKVDLVYIDPPFMVNSDFRADNSIDIDLDEDAGVQAKKEPSLVEILAYRDTWRQGLDSFLTMLRQRLVLLKDLLSPTGSIYVHLDWHAVHYVKVLMDEVFGYENFQNEIIWKRTSARSDAKGFNHVHDSVLAYGASGQPFWNPVYGPLSTDYIRSHYNQVDEQGRRFRLDNLTSPNPRPNMVYEWKGYAPPPNGWRYSQETMAEMDRRGLIYYPKQGGRLAFKRYLDDEGMPILSIWSDLPPVNSQSADRLGYPTQKPVPLIERIVSASCPPHGLVLDCFLGSGTTIEAAERLGRRWIGIDCGKYAIHLARKRLIQLHGQPRPVEKPQYDYVECDHCKNIERKEKSQRSPGSFSVRPFTVENMGVYQRAEEWQDFQVKRSRYRDEMIKVFGGEPVAHSPLLHGRKGASWVHVGPLDGPVSESQVWSIAREAQRTNTRAVTVLSADFDPFSGGGGKEEIRETTGVSITIRVIPSAALDEVKRRIEIQDRGTDSPVESMAVPAFYAPLSIVLAPEVKGRTVRLHLSRCEVDIESFLASQRPADVKKVTDGMTPTQRRKAEDAAKKWAAREEELQRWLKKADSWQKFVDFWAVDWDYGSRVDPHDKPIFETDWQSFRLRKSKGELEPLLFVAEFQYAEPGQYWIAARVTDVFGNDGIATVRVTVK